MIYDEDETIADVLEELDIEEEFPDTEEVLMSEEERQAAIAKFFAKGGKVKKCPPRAAKEIIWIGGKPTHVQGDEKDEKAA